jgi:hypothetical protein
LYHNLNVYITFYYNSIALPNDGDALQSLSQAHLICEKGTATLAAHQGYGLVKKNHTLSLVWLQVSGDFIIQRHWRQSETV